MFKDSLSAKHQLLELKAEVSSLYRQARQFFTVPQIKREWGLWKLEHKKPSPIFSLREYCQFQAPLLEYLYNQANLTKCVEGIEAFRLLEKKEVLLQLLRSVGLFKDY
jgi:hypothetical protein